MAVAGVRLRSSDRSALVWTTAAPMFGTSVAESTGTIADVDARVHSDDLIQVRAARTGAIEQVNTVGVQFRIRWRDGKFRWRSGRARALADDDRTVRALTTAYIDDGVRSDFAELPNVSHIDGAYGHRRRPALPDRLTCRA